MEDALVLQQLEDLAEVLQVEVRYAVIERQGGLCRYRGRTCLIVNRALSIPERVRLIAHALGRFPLDDVYIRPQVRRLLEQEHPTTPAGSTVGDV